ncbi:MAG: sialidase family protein [Gaiellaceae bacterium]
MLPWRTSTALVLTAATVATAALAPVVVSGPSPFSGCPSPPSFEGAEVEPALAAHPRRAGRLVAVYQQDRYHGGGARGIVAATSTDGGKTWRKAALPVSACAGPGARPAPFASDPWASVGPDGRIYASTLSDVVSVTTSADWGRTWSTPVSLRGRYGLTDKETVTADPRKPGWAYVTWSDYQQTSPPATTSDEVVSVTHDGGRSWSAPRVVVRHGNEAGPEDGQIVVDPRNGRLYLFTAWIRNGYATPTRPAWYLVSRSDDGGRHWSAARRFGSGTPAERHGGPVVRSSPQVPSFAIDAGGTLYAVWQDARLEHGAQEDILLARSTDGGRRWSTPRRISRLSGGAAIIPTIAAGGNGSLAVLYLQLDASGAKGRYRIARSRDGGRHVTDSVASTGFAITDAPNITPSPLVPGGYFVGDYMGAAALANGGFGLLYVTARAGASDKTDVFYVSRP